MVGAMAVGAIYGVDVRKDVSQPVSSIYKQRQMYAQAAEVRTFALFFLRRHSSAEVNIVHNIHAHGSSAIVTGLSYIVDRECDEKAP